MSVSAPAEPTSLTVVKHLQFQLVHNEVLQGGAEIERVIIHHGIPSALATTNERRSEMSINVSVGCVPGHPGQDQERLVTIVLPAVLAKA